MTFSGRYFDILRRLVGNVSQRCMQDHMGRSLGRLQEMSQGRRQETSFGVTYSTIGYVLRRSVQDVHGMSVGNALSVTYRTVLGHPWKLHFHILRTPAVDVSWRYIEDHMGTSIRHLLQASSGRPRDVILPSGISFYYITWFT